MIWQMVMGLVLKLFGAWLQPRSSRAEDNAREAQKAEDALAVESKDNATTQKAAAAVCTIASMSDDELRKLAASDPNNTASH